MLHNLAHIELNAIDLAWDTVVGACWWDTVVGADGAEGLMVLMVLMVLKG